MLNDLSPEMLATDLAEYLVRKGVPFRDTHHVAGTDLRHAARCHLYASPCCPMSRYTAHLLRGAQVLQLSWQRTGAHL
jgi:argininosuccinate lyase